MKWLTDCDLLAIPDTELGYVYHPDTVDCDIDFQVVPVVDNGDDLVDVRDRLRTLWVYSWLGFSGLPPAVLLRSGLIERLVSANAALPPGFEIVVLDGWRSRSFQEEVRSYYAGSSGNDIAGFVADPNADARSIPPHVTGGAVDLTLCWRGAALGLGSDFDEFSRAASADAALTGLISARAHDLRGVLGRALTDVELVSYSLEWWHWSYGDQLWASTTGRSHAIYGEWEPKALRQTDCS